MISNFMIYFGLLLFSCCFSLTNLYKMRQNNRAIEINTQYNQIPKNASKNMKKVSQRSHPLQQSIESYQKPLLGQFKHTEKGEENKLKKISRNRLVIKQPTFPAIKEDPPNKENQQPRIFSASQKREKTQFKAHSKNLSFFKIKPVKLQNNKSKLQMSQNLSSQAFQQLKIKEHNLKKLAIFKENKLIPKRNCASAELKKDDSKPILPQKIKQIRRINHLRKSRVLKEGEDTKQISLVMQGQRLAYEGRRQPEENSSMQYQPFVSLQDFLNQWKSINIR